MVTNMLFSYWDPEVWLLAVHRKSSSSQYPHILEPRNTSFLAPAPELNDLLVLDQTALDHSNLLAQSLYTMLSPLIHSIRLETVAS
jgi:hypothetical protein